MRHIELFGSPTNPFILLSETLPHLLNQLFGSHGTISTSFILKLSLIGILIPFIGPSDELKVHIEVLQPLQHPKCVNIFLNLFYAVFKSKYLLRLSLLC
jgi:hypothetical protein